MAYKTATNTAGLRDDQHYGLKEHMIYGLEGSEMASKLGAVVLAVVLGGSFAAEAKTLYVDPLGNDAVTYDANSASSPWRTIGRAAWGSTNRGAPSTTQAARAGDVVIVRGGTYSTTGTANRIDPAYNPVNSGAAGSPIVFQAQGTVILTQSGTGPLIGANGNDRARNYITWKGFTINEINAMSTSDTGPVVLWSTTGSVIEDVTIDGFDNGVNGNNHNGIRLENARNPVIRNNRIYNVLNFGTRQMNGAGIMAYFSDGAVIENNEITNCGSAIFIKGGNNTNFTVRFNNLYQNGVGVQAQYTGTTGEHRIYQNLVRQNDLGISVRLNAHNVRVVNNTLIDNSLGIQIIHWSEPISNVMVMNNIVRQGSGEVINGGEATSVGQFSLDRNVYSGSQRWSMAGVAYSSLATWRNALGGCPGNGNECAAVSADPLFTNAAAGDYRLQAASPARNIGVDVLDLDGDGSTTDAISAGAYVSGTETIGRTGSPPSSALPAPTALRLVSP